MRKQLVIALMLSIIFTGAFAQDVAFGLKGGLNLGTLNLKDAESSYDSRTGYHAGLFLRTKGDNIGFQPELLLSTHRGDIENITFGTAQESFTYLTVPLLLKFYPVLGLNLQVGPQFGFLVDGEREYKSLLRSGKEDIKDHYKSSDVALSFGAGYDFDFGLGIDVRYNLGLQDINDAVDGEKVNSRVIMISLGWNFVD